MRVLFSGQTGFFLMRLLICVSTVVLPAVSVAHADSPGIDKVRLALLYRITQFTLWPEGTFESDSSNLEICFLGEDSEKLADLFRDSTRDKSSQGHGFTQHSFTRQSELTSYLEGGDKCHYLHMIAEESLSEETRGLLATKGAVISGETEEALEAGGLIALMVQGGKLRIFINKEELKAQSVSFDSRLLALARMR